MSVPSALIAASGTGRFWRLSAKTIRLCRKGCTNRPFYQIVVMERRKGQQEAPIEQVGTYDPLPNQNNEQLVSINFERVRHWLGSGAHISRPAAELFGLSGFLPIHPRTYMNAWRIRQRRAWVEEEAKKAGEEVVKAKRGQFQYSGIYTNSDLAEYEISEEK